jgi:sucrose-6-phosphate hydrolase SacC (GH32 family)
MSNWEYARDVPTSPWRSAMTIPRELSLATINESCVLIQKPIHTYSQNQFVVTFDELEDSEIVLENPENQRVVITYLPSEKKLTFDRSGAWIPESPMTSHTMEASNPTMTLMVDRSGIEIFADSGSAVMTNLTLLDQATVITSAKVTLKTL